MERSVPIKEDAHRPLLGEEPSPNVPWEPQRSGAGRLTERRTVKPSKIDSRTGKRLSRMEWLHRMLDRTFCISARGSTVQTEIRAGTTAFLATANNFIVNAHILSHAGLDTGTTVVSGAFASALGCIASGVLSNLPLGIVPSIGPNVFLAYSLVTENKHTTEEALAIAWATGLLLFGLSLTPVVKLALGLVPLSVKFGLVVGTGLLTALIGLKSIGVVVPDVVGQDIVALGQLQTLEVKIAVVFLVLSASMLHLAVKGAVLVGMLGATLTYWICTNNWPDKVFEPHFLTFHAMDLRVLTSFHAWMQVGALLLMLLFSISGAVLGAARMANLMRPDGGVNGRTSVFLCCGAASTLSAMLGCSPIFVSLSAAAGIRDGGRTGLVSVVVGFWSLLTAFLCSPLAAAMPKCAIAPVLVLVGVSMTGEAAEIQWWNIQDALPAFLCAVFQPFTYSVSNGIYAGVGMSVTLFFTTGRFISYVPRLHNVLLLVHKRLAGEHDVLENIPHVHFKRAPSPFDPTPTMLGRTRSRSPKERLLPRRENTALDPSVRGKLHNVGMGTTEQASWLIQQAAKLVGFDGDAAVVAFEERQHQARNTHGHAAGGFPGFELDLAVARMEGLVDIALPPQYDGQAVDEDREAEAFDGPDEEKNEKVPGDKDQR